MWDHFKFIRDVVHYVGVNWWGLSWWVRWSILCHVDKVSLLVRSSVTGLFYPSSNSWWKCWPIIAEVHSLWIKWKRHEINELLCTVNVNEISKYIYMLSHLDVWIVAQKSVFIFLDIFRKCWTQLLKFLTSLIRIIYKLRIFSSEVIRHLIKVLLPICYDTN